MGYTKHKRRRKKNNNAKKFILPTVLLVAILWLLGSSIRHKSPTEYISDIYSWAIGQPPSYPNKSELQAMVNHKALLIDSLDNVIDELKNKSPYRTAIVSTDATSLNLRSQPNLSSDVVIKIPDSSAVKVLYFDEEVLVLDGKTGKWCKIKYADKEGWVWGNYLQISQ